MNRQQKKWVEESPCLFEGRGELACATEDELYLRSEPDWRTPNVFASLNQGDVLVVLGVKHHHDVHSLTGTTPFLRVLTSHGMGWLYGRCVKRMEGGER